MQPAQAQAQQEAQDALHHPATLGPGEEIQGQAVPEHSRKGRVLELAASHWNTGLLLNFEL